MIVVHLSDGTSWDFENGIRYCTDEHNNLEVMGRNGQPQGCIAAGCWTAVSVDASAAHDG